MSAVGELTSAAAGTPLPPVDSPNTDPHAPTDAADEDDTASSTDTIPSFGELFADPSSSLLPPHLSPSTAARVDLFEFGRPDGADGGGGASKLTPQLTTSTIATQPNGRRTKRTNCARCFRAIRVPHPTAAAAATNNTGTTCANIATPIELEEKSPTNATPDHWSARSSVSDLFVSSDRVDSSGTSLMMHGRPSTAGPSIRRPTPPTTTNSNKSTQQPPLCQACANGVRKVKQEQPMMLSLSSVPATPSATAAAVAAAALTAIPPTPRFNKSLSARQARSKLHIPPPAAAVVPPPTALPVPPPPSSSPPSIAPFLTTVSAVRDHRSLLNAFHHVDGLAFNRRLEVELIRRELVTKLSELQTLQDQLETLRSMNTELRSNLELQKLDLKHARDSERHMYECQRSLESEHARLHVEYGRLSDIMRQLKDELEVLKLEHEANLGETQRCKDELKVCQQQLSERTYDYEILLPHSQMLEVCLKEVRLKLDNLQTSYTELQQTHNILVDQHTETVTHKYAAEKAAQEGATRYEWERQLHSALKREHTNLQESFRQVNREKDALLDELHRSKVATHSLKVELSSIHASEAKVERFETSKILETQALIVRQKSSNQDLTQRCQELEHDLTIEKERSSAHQHDYERCQQQLEQLREMFVQLQTQYDTNVKGSQKQEQQLLIQTSRFRNLTEKLTETESKESQATQRTVELQQQKDDLSQRVTTLNKELIQLRGAFASEQVHSSHLSESLAQVQDSKRSNEQRLNDTVEIYKSDLQKVKLNLVEETSLRRSIQVELRTYRSRCQSVTDKLTKVLGRHDALTNAHADCIQRTKELESLRKRCVGLENRLSVCQQRLLKSSEDVQRERTEVGRMECLYKKEHTDRHQLQLQLQQSTTTLLDTEHKLSTTVSEKMKFEELNDVRRMTQLHLTKSSNRFKKLYEDGQNDLVRLKGQLETCQVRLSEVTQQYESGVRQRQDLEGTIREMRKEMSKLEFESTQLQRVRSDMIAWRREQVEMEHTETMSVTKLQSDLKHLQQQLSDMTFMKSEAEETLRSLETDLQHRREDYETLQHTFDEERCRSEKEFTQVQEENEKLRQELTTCEARCLKLREEYDKEQQQTIALTTLTTMLRQQHTDDQKSLNSLQSKLDGVLESHRTTESQLIQDLKTSHSETLERLEMKLSKQVGLVTTLTEKIRLQGFEDRKAHMKMVEEVEKDFKSTIMASTSFEHRHDMDASNNIPDIHLMYRTLKNQFETTKVQHADQLIKVEIRLKEALKEKTNEVVTLQTRLADLELRCADEVRSARITVSRSRWLSLESYKLRHSIPVQLGLQVLNSSEGLRLNAGLLVTDILESSCKVAGLRLGDVIEQVYGCEMNGVDSFQTAIKEYGCAGSACHILVRRVAPDGDNQTRHLLQIPTYSPHYTPHQLTVLERNERQAWHEDDEAIIIQMLAARGIRHNEAEV